jgi:aminoglycoside phosphotransferase (APT) family kinase protein
LIHGLGFGLPAAARILRETGKSPVMSQTWDDVFSPSAELAEKLVKSQFPQFENHIIIYLGEGWDCVAYRCGDWVFRFPRRPTGVQTLATEIATLPQLGWDTLVGSGTEAFPHAFLGTLFQHGQPLERYPGMRNKIAAELGNFLRDLHLKPPPTNLSEDVMGKLDLGKRVPQIQKLLGRVPDWIPRNPLGSADLVLVHGDLYCRHVYVTNDGHLAGIIDWGDLHLGHRSCDLACAWSLFDEANRLIFWESYGAVAEETKSWARFRALYHTLLLQDYAQHQKLEAVCQGCEAALKRIL